jgi:SAM-dependent MidA family methyltransferase
MIRRRLDDAVLNFVNRQVPRIHRHTLPVISTVRQALQSALDENGGIIPFNVFMGIALHHPEDGYYVRNIRGIGARGDFTTVPQMTPALGRTVADWLRREAAARHWKTFHVIECGPGDGSLAENVMKSFGWLERRRISLHLVETSEPLRAQQHHKLGHKATWHRTIAEALVACGGRGLIYHNEFFDAFPCRIFRKEDNLWTEIHLKVTDGKLREVFLAPSRPPPDSDVFRRDWPDGQRVEVFESVHDWLRELSGSWRAGAMLTIEYGGTADEIYHRRLGGTLRAYRGQQRLTGGDVYELPGRQDITADVNFDDLQRWAREFGWKTEGMKSLEAIAPGAPGAEAFHCISFAKL